MSSALPVWTKERLLRDPNATFCRWRYWHSFGRNGAWRYKYGIVFGQIRHTYRHWARLGAKQLSLVQFIGNVRATKVPYDELVVLSREEFEAQV